MKVGFNSILEEPRFLSENGISALSEKRRKRSFDIKESYFIEKLKKEKPNLTFEEYIRYVATELNEEDSSLFTSTFNLILSLWMLITGIKHKFEFDEFCPVPDSILAICLIQSGILGITINLINLRYQLFGARNKYADNCKIVLQFVFFLNNIMGLLYLYLEDAPDVEENTCFFYIYWFSCFMLLSTSFSDIFFLLLMLLAAIFYYI